MGSFNTTCFITGMNIQSNEPVEILRIRPVQFPEDGGTSLYDWYQPSAFPVSARYYDYGYFQDVENKPCNRVFPPLVADENPRDGGNQFVAMHKSAYNHFSQTLFIDDDFFYESEKFVNKGWKFFKDIFDFIKLNLQKYEGLVKNLSDKNLSDSDALKTASNAIRWTLASREKLERWTNKSPLNFPEQIFFEYGVDYFDDNLAKELYAYTVFSINMSWMHKKLWPSCYASQLDRRQHFEELIKITQQILDEKKRGDEDEND